MKSKSSSDVFNILLQIMDEGRLTDSLGRRIDLRYHHHYDLNGTRQLKDFGRGLA